MFSGIWTKLVAFMGVLVGVLMALLKYKSHQVTELKDENAGHVKKEEIRDEMDEVIDESKKEAKDAKENHDSSNWRDRI